MASSTIKPPAVRKVRFGKRARINRANATRYYWAHKNDPRVILLRKAAKRRYRLKKQYGMTTEDFSVMLGKQFGLCGACGSSMTMLPGNVDSCVIDHSHRTEQVRGLLCNECNSALGHGRDNAVVLRRLADYIERVG